MTPPLELNIIVALPPQVYTPFTPNSRPFPNNQSDFFHFVFLADFGTVVATKMLLRGTEVAMKNLKNAASHLPPYLYFSMEAEGRIGKSQIIPLVGMKKPGKKTPSLPPPSSIRPGYTMWLHWMQIPWGDWSF
jgi:hypothetical protein